MFRLSANILGSEQSARFAIRELLPVLTSGEIKEVSQIIIDDFREIQKGEKTMITSIELGDFLAHSDTKLVFENGVTVFVGDNGAGKSSIIDGITFGLFGQHTRKSNKGLIKRGFKSGIC